MGRITEEAVFVDQPDLTEETKWKWSRW